tara:strand:- start:1111 stop:1674 length:564 start_codon:yes stop_codon:yes gene_type:complete
MANRILLGKHQTYGYGLYVSKPGTDVTAADNYDNLSFTSTLPGSVGSGLTSLNAECMNVAQRGYIDVTIPSGNWRTQANNILFPRSLFNDGSVDRCPYLLTSVGAVTGNSPATQWNVSWLKVRSSNTQDKRFSYHGYRVQIHPYYFANNGVISFTVGRNALYSSSTNNASADVTYRCFYALLYLTLR